MSDNIIDFSEGRFKHRVRIETARAKAECRAFRETADLLPDGPEREALLSLANRDPVEIAKLTVRGQLLMETAEREPDSPELAALTQRLAEEQARAVAARRAQAVPVQRPARPDFSGFLKFLFSGFSAGVVSLVTGSTWAALLMFLATYAVLRSLDEAPVVSFNSYTGDAL